MRAAFFHDHRFPRDAAGTYYSYGGLSHSVFQRYLKHFHEVVVVGRVYDVSDTGRSDRWTVASGPGVTMDCLDQMSPLGILTGGVARQRIRAVLERVDCAIVRLPSVVSVLAANEAIRLRKPWMAEVVGCTWDALWNHGTLRARVAAPLLYQLNRRAVAKAPFALYVSDRFLQRRYPCGGDVVGCSDVSIAPPDDDVLERRLARIAAGLRGSPVKLGLVGSLDVDYKGHETALRALRRLKDLGVPVRMSFLGSGDPARWRALAERLGVAGDVVFSGTLPSGGPVLKWMDELDVFTIPSLQEGLPRALVEAMSRALPAVGAATGGIPELIDASFLHPGRDAPSLARVVAQLVQDRSAASAQAQRNFEKARCFTSAVLETRRDAFMERFRGSIHPAAA
jgi:glycosyltransferase involved in cell wall biosynthesis